ncbi:MAG: hypothetical protein QW273_03270 [Candidatus Pacearchaeota archaeon]
MKWKKKKNRIELTLVILVVTFFFIVGLVNFGFAGIGQNVTVTTILQVGNVFPEILNVTVNDNANSINLVANDSVLVSCIAIVRDWNGEDDIVKVNATFFDKEYSFYDDLDNKNYHYSNNSCEIIKDFGNYLGYNDDEYLVLANCSFYVEYYANASSWQCYATAEDSYGWTDNENYNISINPLLSLGLPDIINYGTVNATYVSEEVIVNVTNVGNVMVNLTLEGYAQTIGDGYAMNCSLPPSGTGKIPIYYEKYNLTESNPGTISSLSEFEEKYINLTSSQVVKKFELDKRRNETYNEAVKDSFWRIYIPVGVAGNCTGNIIFGATVAPEM